MTIGFDQTLYRVNESVGAVEVCASVRGGVALDREVVVQYSTADESAVGMEYVCLCVRWGLKRSSTLFFNLLSQV